MTDKIADLILHSVEQKPVDFETAFNSLIKDRLVVAVDNRKQDIAKTLFNPVSNDQSDETVDDLEYNDLESEEETNG